MKYTTEQVEQLAATLRELPPIEKKKQEHGKQEVVKMLIKEIVALQKRGYSFDQISEVLRSNGFDITTPSLKSYLQRAKAAKKADTPRRRPVTSPAVSEDAAPVLIAAAGASG